MLLAFPLVQTWKHRDRETPFFFQADRDLAVTGIKKVDSFEEQK